MIFDTGNICQARRKVFCERVSGLGRDMREPAAFKAVVAKASMDAVQGSFRSCNVNFVETTKVACSKAVATKDWAFVGNGVCDDDVRAAGATYCKGRDYYLVDRSLMPMCNRYARLTRGGAVVADGDAASAAGAVPAKAAPEPPKPDPVQQGVDALRKLLPF